MNKFEIIQFLSDFLKQEVLANGVQFTEQTPFSTLGMDSYSIINMLIALEEKSGKSIIENGIKNEHIISVETFTEFVLTRN